MYRWRQAWFCSNGSAAASDRPALFASVSAFLSVFSLRKPPVAPETSRCPGMNFGPPMNADERGSHKSALSAFICVYRRLNVLFCVPRFSASKYFSTTFPPWRQVSQPIPPRFVRGVALCAYLYGVPACGSCASALNSKSSNAERHSRSADQPLPAGALGRHAERRKKRLALDLR